MPTDKDPTPEQTLERLFNQAMRDSGLPYRSPSHIMALQLVAAAQAAAYARALALLTGTDRWKSRAASLEREVTARSRIDQGTISRNERQVSDARRYGLRY